MCASEKLPFWAQHDVVRHIFTAAAGLGGEARIVGGAVRDWLAGRAVGDIDMTVNLPIQVIAGRLRQIRHIKVINTGLKHGTVTVVDAAQSIELTQTRSDVATDGRHAVVEFQDDWAEDAARRDFTINALYIDAGGRLFDPLGGQADLAAKRLRFVGRAADRVQEDTLRMLRYCRFFIDYNGAQHDQQAVAALRSFAPLAAGLSGERVAKELRKILSNEHCAVAVGLLHETGLDQSVLGVGIDIGAIPSSPKALRLVTADHGWLVLFSAMIPESALASVLQRLRLSRVEQKFCLQMATSGTPQLFAELTTPRWRQSAFFMHRRAAAIYACAAWRLRGEFRADIYQQLQQWKPPKFPLSGADLLSHGVDNGPALGQMLKDAETLWVQSDFTLNKSALLNAVISSGK
jgi:tRNA nucleotidyltransferase/poly(A) polymerase